MKFNKIILASNNKHKIKEIKEKITDVREEVREDATDFAKAFINSQAKKTTHIASKVKPPKKKKIKKGKK